MSQGWLESVDDVIRGYLRALNDLRQERGEISALHSHAAQSARG